jgi:ribonuclease E
MKRMLINGYDEGESRVALLDQGRLDEYFVERASHKQYLGNIYIGRVVNVERGIQAAFVDVGLDVNGFLHISDAFFSHGRHRDEGRSSARKGGRNPGPPRIQDIFKTGQKVLVQVIKEVTGSKGPALSTNISLPGRYIVLMPFYAKMGVSRKIIEEKERDRLKKLVATLKVPQGMGGIVRTAGVGRRKPDFQRDMTYLDRLWRSIQRLYKETEKPGVIYQESELVIRVLRDIFGPDVKEIVVDSPDLHKKALDFIRIVSPRQKGVLKLYEGKEPLFHRFGVEKDIEKIFERKVPLKSGGSLVIDQTEAMVCIDVNSGRYRKGANVEETALAIDLEAASEIARQIRLRDLGGLIVMDFIDMRESRNRRAVEKELRQGMVADRARNKILRMSEFCLVEMTRRKMKHSLRVAHFDVCPICQGSGYVLSAESLELGLFRALRVGLGHDRVRMAEVSAPSEVAMRLLNDRRAEVANMEDRYKKRIIISLDPNLPQGRTILLFRDEAGDEVQVG